MPKRVEAQTGNISFNPITGVVQLYNADVQVVETTTTGSGGLLVDKGAGLEQVALLSEITGAITTSTPLSLEADIVTATPPTNEAVTDLLRFVDNDSSDVLGTLGYTGSSVLSLANVMQGSNMTLTVENAAGATQTLITLDPDTEQVIVPLSNDAVTPTLAFGDGDSGFYETADDQLRIAIAGTSVWQIDSSFFGSQTTGAGTIRNLAATGTVPGFTIKGDIDTGIGAAAADQLSLIAGAVEGIRVTETGVATTDQVTIFPGATLRGDAATPSLAFGDGDTGFYESSDDILYVTVGGANNFRFQGGTFVGSSSGAAYVQASAGSAGAPTYAINADTDTGVYSPAADQLSLAAGGVEMLRVAETGVATTDQVTIAPGATLRGAAATPSLAFGDGDSGFYESGDDTLVISLGGAAQWDYATSAFQGTGAGRPALQNETATTSNPTLIPNKAAADTGIGGDGADVLSFIAGGVEIGRVDQANDRFVTNAPLFIQEQASAGADVTAYGQIWVRDDAPNTLMVTDDAGNDFTANNVLEIEYTYSSATAVADPGAGTLRFDTVTIGSITEMYIDDLDNTGRDNSIMLANLAVGDLITFRSATDPADYIVATVDAATTDNAGYWTIPLAPVHVGTIFTNGDLLRMSVEWQSQAIAGSGTVTTSGSPLVNQLAYFSDPTTITGDADFTTDGNVLYIGNDTSSRELRLGGNATTARSFISMKDVGGTARTIVQRASSNNYLEIGSSFFGTIIDGGGVASPNSVAVNVPTTFAISNSGFTEYGQFNIGGSNLNLIGTSINSFKINNMTLMLEEQASAAADAANFGQIWVQTETPNRLVFTDDTGQDIRVTPNQATVQTTDATLTELIAISVPTDTTFGFRMNVVGTQATTGDTVFESIFGAVRNQASTTALVGSTVVDRTDDAGATTWVIDVTATSTPDELVVSVTGEAAHTIDWKVSVEILEV